MWYSMVHCFFRKRLSSMNQLCCDDSVSRFIVSLATQSVVYGAIVLESPWNFFRNAESQAPPIFTELELAFLQDLR